MRLIAAYVVLQSIEICLSSTARFRSMTEFLFSDTDSYFGVRFHFRLWRNVCEDLEGTRDIHNKETYETGRTYFNTCICYCGKINNSCAV